MALFGIGALALTLAGCGSDESATPESPPSSTTSASSTQAEGQQTTGSSTTQAPAVPNCRLDDLSVTLGAESAAAGSVSFPLVFTNITSRACTLDGFPGVSYANGPDSDPVGSPAERTTQQIASVTVQPSGQASALVTAVVVGNYPAERCVPTEVAGLQVYPPNDTGETFLVRAGTACSLPDEGGQLKVGPVVAGVSGQ